MSQYKIIGRANPKEEFSLKENQPKEGSYKIIGKEDPSQYQFKNNEPSQEESFLNKLPRNILIGLTHAGRNLHNLPHDLISQLESNTKGIGDIFKNLPGTENIASPKSLSSRLPYDTNNYADVFGQEGEGTLADTVIQKGIEHAPELLGLRGLIRKFPLTQKSAARSLKKAENQIKSFGGNTPISQEIIDESVKFLPKTHASREMLAASKEGDYPSSFALQSQIGKHERDLKRSSLASERLLAPEARELKQIVLGTIETSLRGQGLHKEADLIKKGINDYRRYIKIRDEVYPVLKKIGIPTSLIALTNFFYDKGKKILK